MSIATIGRPAKPHLSDATEASAEKPSRAAKEWRATLVRDSVTVREAIHAIDESALQIALIVDAD